MMRNDLRKRLDELDAYSTTIETMCLLPESDRQSQAAKLLGMRKVT